MLAVELYKRHGINVYDDSSCFKLTLPEVLFVRGC